ncbi:hypothetical protein KO489_04965 [Reinekea forsetii]|nr:hypothetical protein [Reinekea forsetii]
MSYKSVCLGAFFMAFLVGCTSMPKKTETIYEALVVDTSLRSVVNQCAALGSEEKKMIVEARNSWWQRNASHVMAADWGLLKLNWDDAHANAQSQRALMSMALLENIQEESKLENTRLIKVPVTTKQCQKLAEKMSKGKLDLAQSKADETILKALNDDRVNVEGQAQVAQSINNRYRKYGRSLFVVEKTLREAGCSKPTISLIRNAWPIEVFDATCNQSEYLLVQCDWGRCEIKR